MPKDLGKAAELYQKAADQGNADAQVNLGWLYQMGEGVPKDLRKAAELYQKAADQGNARAQFNLGWLYENGWGVPKDLEKQHSFIKKRPTKEQCDWKLNNYPAAANQEYAPTQSNLGLLYQNGEGVTKDLAKAVELYQKAADQGNAGAQNNLGVLYQNGEGVPKDLESSRALSKSSQPR